MSVELRIASAYVKLASIPDDDLKASVSIAWIGNCEVRMFRPQVTDDDALFWLELIDHGTRMSVDSFRCPKIEDATPVFQELIWQAAHLNDPDRGGTETQ